MRYTTSMIDIHSCVRKDRYINENKGIMRYDIGVINYKVLVLAVKGIIEYILHEDQRTVVNV